MQTCSYFTRNKDDLVKSQNQTLQVQLAFSFAVMIYFGFGLSKWLFVYGLRNYGHLVITNQTILKPQNMLQFDAKKPCIHGRRQNI